MLENIPQSRQLAYLLALGLLPILFAIFHVRSSASRHYEAKQWVDSVREAAVLSESKQALNRRVRHHFSEIDHFYIDKHVETLKFLRPEIETLQRAEQHNPAGSNEDIKKRLAFLTGDQNALRFSEGQVTAYEGFQETLETQLHPVEVNIQDVKKVLSRIEGLSIPPTSIVEGRPQLIVTDFKLDRKTTKGDNEVFSLNMKMIKREFL